jgi:hypothetical protein
MAESLDRSATQSQAGDRGLLDTDQRPVTDQ